MAGPVRNHFRPHVPGGVDENPSPLQIHNHLEKDGILQAADAINCEREQWETARSAFPSESWGSTATLENTTLQPFGFCFSQSDGRSVCASDEKDLQARALENNRAP